MLTAKQLLLQQTAEAFRGRADMPLLASLDGISDAEAAWQPDSKTPSVEHLVRHIAWSKATYCRQGFGREMPLIDQAVSDDGDVADLPWEFPCGAGWGRVASPGITGAIALLEKSQLVLTGCLGLCADEALAQPIPNRHGKSAANFFWIMAMHDLYHAGQIRTRRTLYRTQVT